MATIYNIELTSHYLNFDEKTIKEKIEKSINTDDGNLITVEILSRE